MTNFHDKCVNHLANILYLSRVPYGIQTEAWRIVFGKAHTKYKKASLRLSISRCNDLGICCGTCLWTFSARPFRNRSDISCLYFKCACVVFGIFKAGSTVFSKNSYDIISSMPVKTSSVVIGRLASMYLEDLTPTLLIMPSGTVTFGIVEGCNIVFYILTVINNNNRIRIEEL